MPATRHRNHKARGGEELTRMGSSGTTPLFEKPRRACRTPVFSFIAASFRHFQYVNLSSTDRY